MVEPDLIGLSAKQDSRAEFVFLKVVASGCPGGRDSPESGTPEGLLDEQIHAVAASGTRRPYITALGGFVGCGMLSVKILICEERILFYQVLEDVVPDAYVAVVTDVCQPRRAPELPVSRLAGQWRLRAPGCCRLYSR